LLSPAFKAINQAVERKRTNEMNEEYDQRCRNKNLKQVVGQNLYFLQDRWDFKTLQCNVLNVY